MSLSPEAQVEYSVQLEITRLTNDNLVRSTTTHGVARLMACGVISAVALRPSAALSPPLHRT